jgi:hypothetical protein
MAAPAYFYEAPTFDDEGGVVAIELAEVDDDGYHTCCSVAPPDHDADCRFSPPQEPLEICRNCRRDVYFEVYQGFDGESAFWMDTDPESSSAYCDATLPEDAPEGTEPGPHEPEVD